MDDVVDRHWPAPAHAVTFDPPSRLLDSATGSVLLRLVPFHLARLHAPESAGDDADQARLGLPFPFLRGAEPIDVVLRRGMTSADVARYGGGFEPNSSLGSTAWWRWASYALTPFGWVAFPTPFFTDGVLSALSLNRHGGTADENFAAMKNRLELEIGAPSSSASAASPSWTFDWGTVALSFEPRDLQAQLRIVWVTNRR
jgi:hypothetical protein